MIFHVMSKGDGGDDIFLSRSDWQEFVAMLSEVKARNHFDLFAYCLMPNHFHLLVRLRKSSLSQMMQHLLTRYSKYLNSRLNRRGHVFQGRFRALICDRDSYFLELIRYIHLNPVRAHLVSDARDWPWSGHHEMVSSREPRLLDIGFPFSLFGAGGMEPVRSYLDFLRAKDEVKESAIAARLESIAEDRPVEVDVADTEDDHRKLLEIALAVSSENSVPLDELRGRPSRTAVSRARHDFIRRSVACGMRSSRIAAFINRSPSLVSKVIGAG